MLTMTEQNKPPETHKEYKAIVMSSFLQTSPDDCEDKRYAKFGEEVIAIPAELGPGALIEYWIYPESMNSHWYHDADKYGVGAWRGDIVLLDDEGNPMPEYKA